MSVEHSRKMAAVLKSHNKDVTYVEFRNGNHNIEIEDHRLATLNTLEAFVAKHLGSASLAAKAKNLNRQDQTSA